MNATNPKVDAFLKRASKWQAEIAKLRTIVLSCGLSEEMKWGKPCYTLQGSNIVLIMPLKERCVLLFFKGALLKDPQGILVVPGENSQSARQLRLTNVREIVALEPTLKAYIHQAMDAEKAGLKVTLKKNTELTLLEELQNKLEGSPALKTAFDALTPGRQRAYNMYFSAAKQSKTRESRIEKYRKQILQGKGLGDEDRRPSNSAGPRR